MHPIERLRFVARAQDVPGDVLAIEATSALVSFADEPAALVAACRRVLARQVGCGPLWWACARLLTAERVRETALETITLLEGDTTGAALSLSLDGGSTAGGPRDEGIHDAPEPQWVEAHAVGDGSAVVDRYQLDAMHDDDAPRWLIIGVGVQISDPMWCALVEHWSVRPRATEELVPLERFTHFVGPSGPLPMVALDRPDCPVAPELFRLVG